MKRSQSFGSSTQRSAAKSFRLVLAHPQQLGRGEARHREVARDRAEPRHAHASSARTAAPLRPSFQRIAGRSTWPAGVEQRLAPCIWPDRPIARTAASASACDSPQRVHRRPRARATTAAGACSDHNGCRPARPSSGARASATMRWSSVQQQRLRARTSRGRGPRYKMSRLAFCCVLRTRRRCRSGCRSGRRNSVGVMPLISRKRRLKLATLLKPTW